MSRNTLWTLVAGLALMSLGFIACSDSDSTEPDDTEGTVEIVEVEPSAELHQELTSFAQEVLADSVDAWQGNITPISVPIPSGKVIEDLESEFPDIDFIAIQIDPVALDDQPFQLDLDDLQFFRILDPSTRENRGYSSEPQARPNGNATLKSSVKNFIDVIDGTGLDTRELENAWSSTRFHDAANWPGGLPPGTADGAVHTWDNAVFWQASWHGNWLFIWRDGFNHMILASRHVTTMNAGTYTTSGQLTTAAATVLHELGHVIMSRTGCAEDDTDDEMAATLERVMKNRVEIELARQGGGTPAPNDARDYSDAVKDLVDRGGTNCLRDLGWGLPAGELTLFVPETVQTGQMYTLEILVKQIGGNPAANAAAWTWVDVAVETVTTNGLGIGTRDLVAPNKPGEVQIQVKCWGLEATATVRVVGDPVGACCSFGTCTLTTLAECSSKGGEWLGTESTCTPNPCPLPGKCCLPDGFCSSAADSLACVNEDGEWFGEGTTCDTETCDEFRGPCCFDDGTCVITVPGNCDGTFLFDEIACDPNPCPQPGACCIGTNCSITLPELCDGEHQGPGTACDPDPCHIPGACCASDGSCTVVLEAECNGTFEGEGTNCDPNVCPRPGACCNEDGSCDLTLPAGCDSGAFQGQDTVCDPNPCPQPPEGACCWGVSNEQCTVRSEIRCVQELGGDYLGDGTTCFSDPCTDPLAGGCCLDNGSCIFVREESCDGRFLGVGQPCSPEACGPPSLGACCFPSGSCQYVSGPDCASADGAYQGDGTVCDPNPCDQPGEGACCFGSNCNIQTQADCVTNDGVYQGDGTTCDPNPCPQETTGACCFELGSCQLLDQATCTEVSGAYQGDGTVCDPNPCPQPGACCYSGGSCQVIDEGPCLAENGAYQGDGTTCDPNPCDLDPMGACCFANGNCQVATQADCVGADAVYQGDDTVCVPNPCDQPAEGACCFGAACQIQTEADCAANEGIYQGDGTTCDPNPCPQDTGACCFSSGSCQVTTETDCTNADGVYQGNGTSCDPNPCDQPAEGACCFGEACQIQTEADCAANEGEYRGDGTICDPNPCETSTGACCFTSGLCLIYSFDECAELGGTYLGVDTVCDPNPCPQPPQGACCFGTTCSVQLETDCASNEGDYQGDDTTCDPSPCGPQPGACCFGSECTILTESVCDADFQGEGTSCDPNPCPPTGACCAELDVCEIQTEDDCTTSGFNYQGDDTTCDPNPCDPTRRGRLLLWRILPDRDIDGLHPGNGLLSGRRHDLLTQPLLARNRHDQARRSRMDARCRVQQHLHSDESHGHPARIRRHHDDCVRNDRSGHRGVPHQQQRRRSGRSNHLLLRRARLVDHECAVAGNGLRVPGSDRRHAQRGQLRRAVPAVATRPHG